MLAGRRLPGRLRDGPRQSPCGAGTGFSTACRAPSGRATRDAAPLPAPGPRHSGGRGESPAPLCAQRRAWRARPWVRGRAGTERPQFGRLRQRGGFRPPRGRRRPRSWRPSHAGAHHSVRFASLGAKIGLGPEDRDQGRGAWSACQHSGRGCPVAFATLSVHARWVHGRIEKREWPMRGTTGPGESCGANFSCAQRSLAPSRQRAPRKRAASRRECASETRCLSPTSRPGPVAALPLASVRHRRGQRQHGCGRLPCAHLTRSGARCTCLALAETQSRAVLPW